MALCKSNIPKSECSMWATCIYSRSVSASRVRGRFSAACGELPIIDNIKLCWELFSCREKKCDETCGNAWPGESKSISKALGVWSVKYDQSNQQKKMSKMSRTHGREMEKMLSFRLLEKRYSDDPLCVRPYRTGSGNSWCGWWWGHLGRSKKMIHWFHPMRVNAEHRCWRLAIDMLIPRQKCWRRPMRPIHFRNKVVSATLDWCRLWIGLGKCLRE